MATQPPTNQGLLLTSYDELPQLVELPAPVATAGTAVVQVLATYIPSYVRNVWNNNMQFHLPLPMVPGVSCVGRVHSLGGDAVKLKTNDLVYVDPAVYARDNHSAAILQGHLPGMSPEGRVLGEGVWRNGALQKYWAVPLENCVSLNEERLCGELGLKPEELITLFPYIVAAGPLIESSRLQPGETVVVGPATGFYGGSAVEMALALGANVVALSRNQAKLAEMQRELGNPKRFRYVAMTGNEEQDASLLQKAFPNGVDVYNDWSPTGSPDALYLSPIAPFLNHGARIVLSGGAAASPGLPYSIMLLKNLSISGKFMYDRKVIPRVFNLVSSGLLGCGKRSGATVRKFGLHEIAEALQAAEKHGGWRDYTVVAPN